MRGRTAIVNPPPPPRPLTSADRKRVRYALRRIADHDFEALRTAAITLIAWGSGLRLSECLALEVGQVEAARRNSIRERVTLRGQQVKGGKENGKAVSITLPEDARSALRRYLVEAREREWLEDDVHPNAPLFVARRCNGRPGHHPRLAKRSAQDSWKRLQQRAGVPPPLYRFQDLRHDALTVFADHCHGDPWRTAKFARHQNVNTTLSYIHSSMNDVATTAELAARGRYSY